MENVSTLILLCVGCTIFVSQRRYIRLNNFYYYFTTRRQSNIDPRKGEGILAARFGIQYLIRP